MDYRYYVLGVVVILVAGFFAFFSPFGSSSSDSIPSMVPSTVPSVTSVVAKKFFHIDAGDFYFKPSEVSVNLGDEVTIELTSVEGSHGLAIPDFGVNIIAGAGETSSKTFIVNKKGTFPFICSVPCGPGHRSMKGTLIVN